MQDNEFLLRDGTANLTANLAGSYVAMPRLTQPMQWRIIVPSMAEAGDKLVVKFTYSDDGTNAKEIVTLPDITYANVLTNKITEYGTPVLPGSTKVKVDITITDADTGSDFNAGKVLIAMVPAGRHTKQSY
jgi:hypothetical protein